MGILSTDRSFRNVWEHEEQDTNFGFCLTHRLSESGFGEKKLKSGFYSQMLDYTTQGEKDLCFSIKCLVQLWHTQRYSRKQWKLSLCIRRLILTSTLPFRDLELCWFCKISLGAFPCLLNLLEIADFLICLSQRPIGSDCIVLVTWEQESISWAIEKQTA